MASTSWTLAMLRQTLDGVDADVDADEVRTRKAGERTSEVTNVVLVLMAALALIILGIINS